MIANIVMREAIALIVVVGCVVQLNGCTEPPSPRSDDSSAPSASAVQERPDREVYFGDLHVHTRLSFDAYYLFGTRLSVEDAYRFARGEEITYMGLPIRRRQPLDFMAVTDHARILGTGLAIEDPDSALAKSEIGQRFLDAQRRSLSVGTSIWRAQEAGAVPEFDIDSVSRSAWTRIIDAANLYYQPGTFTTLIGYEWTADESIATGIGGPVHRNVIFRGDTAPFPFSSLDSQRPEDLWTYLEEHRSRGIQGHVAPRTCVSRHPSSGVGSRSPPTRRSPTVPSTTALGRRK